jgi:hypothetical protein
MKYDDYVGSCVGMTPTQYLKTYLSEQDRETLGTAIKVFVFLDGYYFTLLSNGKYSVYIDRDTNEFDTFDEAVKHMWDEFVKDEVNQPHPLEKLGLEEDFSFGNISIHNMTEKLAKVREELPEEVFATLTAHCQGIKRNLTLFQQRYKELIEDK